MTPPDNKIGRSEELAPHAGTTYDLIICHGDRIVFHDYYESAATRLRMCGELYSVITEYGPGLAVAEHFPTRQARHDSLLERAASFFNRPEDIPERARADEARLALLVTTFIIPATITLTRASRDPGTQSYRSTC